MSSQGELQAKVGAKLAGAHDIPNSPQIWDRPPEGGVESKRIVDGQELLLDAIRAAQKKDAAAEHDGTKMFLLLLGLDLMTRQGVGGVGKVRLTAMHQAQTDQLDAGRSVRSPRQGQWR